MRVPPSPATAGGVLHRRSTNRLWRAPTLVLALSAAISISLAPPPRTARAGDAESWEYLDLAESIERAKKAHPDVGLERAEVGRARAELRKARAGRWFTGHLTSINGIVNGADVGEVPDGLPTELAPLFSEDDQDDIFNDLNFFTLNTLQVSQPIYTFGKISHGISAAKAGLDAVRAELGTTEQEVVLEVKRIYYGYKLASGVIDELRQGETAFGEAIERAKELVVDGKVSQADVLKLEIAKNLVSARIAEAERGRQESLVAYRRALGLAASARVAPEPGDLEPVVIAELGSESQFRASPSWTAATRGLEARRHELEVERSKLYPDIFLGVSATVAWAPGRDDISNPFLYDQFNLLRGGPYIGLRWELDFATRLAEIEIREAEVARSVAEVEQARLGLPLAIRRAQLAYQEQRTKLELARENRKAGRTLSLLSVGNFRMGIGDADEILESLGMHIQAATTYQEAVFEYNMAVATLSKELGRDLVRAPAGR